MGEMGQIENFSRLPVGQKLLADVARDYTARMGQDVSPGPAEELRLRLTEALHPKEAAVRWSRGTKAAIAGLHKLMLGFTLQS